jgi:hypothetical protein
LRGVSRQRINSEQVTLSFAQCTLRRKPSEKILAASRNQQCNRAAAIGYLERLTALNAAQPFARILSQFPNADPVHRATQSHIQSDCGGKSAKQSGGLSTVYG